MNIYVNGQKKQVCCSSLHELQEELYHNQNIVVILNGFQTGEDMILKDNDQVFFIEKGIMPPEQQLEAMMAARHTPGVHALLKQGKVAIAGLGGLGSAIAIMLARLGVGDLLLVDFDVVEPSNLNRQSYYISHLGMDKTEALKEQLVQINPFIQIHTAQARVTEENAADLFRGYPIVCEAFDSPSEKSMLINTIMEFLPETKLVAASGMAGYSSANTIATTHRFSNLYICGDMTNEASQGSGLMAPRVQICAGHQANMVLRLLLGIPQV